MKNLLVGNGINLRFAGKEYSSSAIVLRVLENCISDDFPKEIINTEPYLLRIYFGKLFLEAREIIKGAYDLYAITKEEKEALNAFKEKYGGKLFSLRISDICFEDYYLIHELLCHKERIQNPEKYVIRESMRMAYLHAIYNHGKLNSIYKQYSKAFIDYLCSFGCVFTTNHDLNVDSVTGKEVIHLHGQFDKRADVYNPESLRNMLPDAPIKTITIEPRYEYLYCNAITTHSGGYKEFLIGQYAKANHVVQGFAERYVEGGEAKEAIDAFLSSGNHPLENLGIAIQKKAAHPEYIFPDYYHWKQFENMTGELDILGLSPWNDFHLFRMIDQARLDKCVYYYFEKEDCPRIQALLPKLVENNELTFKDVHDFWEIVK